MVDQEKVFGGPNKRFFVSMLTRDIELKDAILDLIDNCVDGVMRTTPDKMTGKIPFKGYWADIQISKNTFEISDNCGGISFEDLTGGALSLGRPNPERDKEIPTIGMYGIGMKRAIFKIAGKANITTQSPDGAYSVDYTTKWLSEDNEEWDLPIRKLRKNPLRQNGTMISGSKIRREVKDQFDTDADFIAELKEAISKYYGYIIEKGFTVKVNGETIVPSILLIMRSGSASEFDANSIEPYVFTAEIDNVKVAVVIGFYRPVPREVEIWDEQASPRSADNAGISIICNDRVLILNDKTRLTGWGERGAARYHNQFIAISGQIIFTSNNADKLPISTTKRGIDVRNDIYFEARDRAIEGLKLFIDFTNKWKGMEIETASIFEGLTLSNARSSGAVAEKTGSKVRKMPSARRFTPNLPLPDQKRSSARINFSKPLEEVEIVREFLFDDEDQDAKVVGERAFDYVFERAKK